MKCSKRKLCMVLAAMFSACVVFAGCAKDSHSENVELSSEQKETLGKNLSEQVPGYSNPDAVIEYKDAELNKNGAIEMEVVINGVSYDVEMDSSAAITEIEMDDD